MKKIWLLLFLVLGQATAAVTPKLLLVIVIDQFRYDYLTRFRPEYTAGFDRLLKNGAVFTNARYIHFPTVTAVGHSTILTGATPSVSGIVGNDWFDPDVGARVTSVSDPKTRQLGGNGGEGSSPRRLLVSTVGDELKMAHPGKVRAIGISLKDRAAILPLGSTADGAYWFDLHTGHFVSSTYYFSAIPEWVTEFNQSNPAEKYRGAKWLNHVLPDDTTQLYGTDSRSPLEDSPYGNDIVERFAERALESEQLGKHEFTDLLTVSFSSNDKVGHHAGTYSADQREVTVQTDRIIERLFQAVERQVGISNALVVLTADHGVAPSAEEDAANRMPGGRIPSNVLRDAVQAALAKKYGEGSWVVGSSDLNLFLNRPLIAQKGLDPAEVRKTGAEAVLALPHIQRVYTRDQLLAGTVPGDDTSRRVMNGYHVRRGSDLAVLPEPYWIVTNDTTTHGTTYGYDTHVPVVFMGQGIRPGVYHGNVQVNDIAPTLATLLEIETPSGSVGRVLTEMLQ
jgi:hypothetical protein